MNLFHRSNIFMACYRPRNCPLREERIKMNSRKIRVAAGAALVFGLLSWIPAGAVTIGYPPAEPGGRCLSGFSVPLSGAANQLYKCVNNQWAVVSTLDGGTGPTGATGAAGTNGTNGANGAPGAKGDTGADGTNGTNGENGAPGAPGADGTNGTNGADGADGAPGAPGAKGDTGDKGDPGPAGPALAGYGLPRSNVAANLTPGEPNDVFADLPALVPPAGTYAVNFAAGIFTFDEVQANCFVTIDGFVASDVSEPNVNIPGGFSQGSVMGTGWITVAGDEIVSVACISRNAGEGQAFGQNLNLIPLASVTVPTLP